MSKDYTWQTTLNEIADLNMGQSPDSSFVGVDMLGPAFLQGCAEFGPKYPNAVLFCSKPKKISCVGDTLMSVRAPVGEINKADRQYCIGRGLAAITFKNGISNDFGWHLLKFWGVRLNNVSQGSTFSAISKDDLACLTVFIFEEDVQKAIVLILDTLDNLIFQTEDVIAKLVKIKAGLMQDLLTKGIDENGEIRDPEKHPEQFKDSLLGRIPKDWGVVSIKSIGAKKEYAIVDGPFGSNLKTIHYREYGIPVIQSGYVTSGKFIANNYMYVDETLFNRQKRSSVEPEDIVMAKIGAQCGTCAILPPDHPIGIIAGNCLKISVDIKVCSNHFLLNVLHYYYNTGRLEKLKTETAQPAIGLTNLRNFNIQLPKSTEQDSIVQTLQAHDIIFEAEHAKLGKLKLLKRGLMKDLLTGKVSVDGVVKKAAKPAKTA